jgi:plastocyanin
MSRIRLALACTLAAAFLVPASASAMALPKLVGTVGPGFTISLTKSGAKVRTLKKGKYTIVVHDKSKIHNFHLTGRGVNKVITSVVFVGTKTVTVTLKPGTYKFVCDPHKTIPSMRGSFKVTG